MTKEDYEHLIEDAVANFARMPLNQQTIAQIEYAVVSTQHVFLAENPNFVALHEPRIEIVEGHNINILAPVVTVEEKMESEWRTRESERFITELHAKQKIEDENWRHREANMQRYHRRLLAKHINRNIPPSTWRMWETLTTRQQYAILKDIDYAVRHGKD